MRFTPFPSGACGRNEVQELSNTKTIYFSIAASALKNLRSVKSSDSNCQTRQEGEKSCGNETPMKVAFKRNRVRVAKGARADVSVKSTSPTKKKERRRQVAFTSFPALNAAVLNSCEARTLSGRKNHFCTPCTI